MIGNNFFRYTETKLELNGPSLSFSTQPVGVATENAGSASFVGIATASFPQSVTIDGTITYQWYDQNGPLTDGTNITGSATTTLTLTNLTSSKRVYVKADYNPTDTTGNAVNEPTSSDEATLTVYPLISITNNPTNASVPKSSTTTFTVSAESSDGANGELLYQWSLNGIDLTDTSTITGSQTDTLFISQPNVGVNTVRVKVSHPTATNSPIYSTVATYTVVEPNEVLNLEYINSSSSAVLTSVNLFNNEYTINSSASFAPIVMYASQKDLNVEMDIYASKGADSGSYVGGQGGYSRIRFTMLKDEEYVLASYGPTGAPVLYRKSSVIAVVGKGGDAGSSGNGGRGAGIGIAGENGSSRGSGNGGAVVSTGSLSSTSGIFGSLTSANPTNSNDTKATAPNGGRMISCPRGNQTIPPCQDLGTTKFLWNQTTAISNTASISRGFKQGYGIRQTAGAGVGGGNGGDGVTGGQGGTSGAGGGGGSGYSDGSVTVVESTQGGSVGNSLVKIRLYNSVDFSITPAINGVTDWSLATNGPLILDGASASTYTITSASTKNFTLKMWGQGAGSSNGGYSTGTVSLVKSNVYTVKLNAGGGSSGTNYGWVGGENGGGYAGIFNGTSITQSNAIMIAGGAGGGGYGHSFTAGGTGGGLSGTGGQNSPDSQVGSTGGSGGTQSGGGSGGGAGGQGGGALQGGRGGDGQQNGYPNAGGGGGGGGGYYGGGGGGGGNDNGGATRTASGGGGGSGYTNPSYVSDGVTSSFANASDPNRGNAGTSGYSSRVVITVG